MRVYGSQDLPAHQHGHGLGPAQRQPMRDHATDDLQLAIRDWWVACGPVRLGVLRRPKRRPQDGWSSGPATQRIRNLGARSMATGGALRLMCLAH
jgi:hypothetical protein